MKILSNKILNLELWSSDNKKHSLNSFHSEYIVIYFYPADNTPLCTIQGHQYTSLIYDFKKLGCTVIGISAGNGESKCEYAEKEDFKHLLLADNNYEVSKYFDVYTEQGLPKYPNLKIVRSSFVINNITKNIIREREYVDPYLDAEKNLEFIKELVNKKNS